MVKVFFTILEPLISGKIIKNRASRWVFPLNRFFWASVALDTMIFARPFSPEKVT